MKRKLFVLLLALPLAALAVLAALSWQVWVRLRHGGHLPG